MLAVSRLITGFMFIAIAQPCLAQQWTTVKIDSRALIDFPSNPDSANKEGKVIFTAKDSAIQYTLVKTYVKESDPNADYLELAYAGFAEELNKRTGVTGVIEKDITINKLPGKTYSYHFSKGGIDKVAATRAFYFDGVLYTITYSSPASGFYDESSSNRFLNSFKINTELRLAPLNTISTSSDIDFLWGHVVFAGLFAILAFTLYFIWTRNNPSRLN